ncbi:uncharacterized protein ofcc1 isoform X1 [Syngnathus typhle]|uniref:uncharacterized protein ofcc1 isoform X1 n=1 Tax=Syngnathus typhle TaxID=161592 RepID=UPI002A69AE67|nr:uncharacterized protein ofcc1 isoform X1 [Syngnathus typhle]
MNTHFCRSTSCHERFISTTKKLQQKALQQPKQKKSKSAEFLMARGHVAGMEKHGGGSTELSLLPVRLPREIRGTEYARNYFDPMSAAEQTDSRRSSVAELELSTVVASRDEEVLEVKAGNPLLLHGGCDGAASGSERSRARPTAKTQAGPTAGHSRELGRQAARTVMGSESAAEIKMSEEAVPRHAWLPRERARPDIITLGSLSLQQQVAAPKMSHWVKMKRRLMDVFNGNGKMHPSPSPQPVEVCVRCLRATRDKLPRGLYSVSVALHSHLGGPSLTWNNDKGQHEWMASTDPIEHHGCFYNINLHVNQNLFMILPPARELLPSMVLIFRLTASPGQSSYMKSVLAWGAFPICGPNLSLVEGRYKIPLLRGEPGSVDQFRTIEALISSDLDHWLCNMYFQIRRLPPGASECPASLQMLPLNTPVMLKSAVQHSQVPGQAPPGSKADPQPIHPQLNLLHAGPSSRAGEPGAVHSPQGSPLHLSADSACSSSSLPGKDPSPRDISGNMGAKSHLRREKEEGGIHFKKKPIKKTNSRGPSVSGGSAQDVQNHKMLNMEEMEEYTFSLLPSQNGPSSAQLANPAHLVLCMLPSELGLLLLRQHKQQQKQQQQQQACGSWRLSVLQLSFIMLLLALMWFVRLYLHYCSQWLYLQAIAVPVNKFQFHAHTVDLVYQSSLLHTREELAMVVVGPLTLNAVTFLLVLIRWGCQQIFGSLPSFTSKFIMAQGVWTVLHPLAVLAVDAVLGRLSYSPDRPVGDAAKLFWHFHRVDQSGTAGVIITVFLYAVIFLLSVTILCVYLLRFHNNGRMLDIFQRLTGKEGTYFLPQDLELSNQELSYIVKKAEQWRGYDGERRKVAVYDYIWTAENPLAGSSTPIDDPHSESSPMPHGETSTHMAIYTLYLSGLKRRYRHFLRQPDGAIIEVIGDLEGFDNATRMEPFTGQRSGPGTVDQEGSAVTRQLRKRKKLFGRCPRVEPVGGSRCDSSYAQELNQ